MKEKEIWKRLIYQDKDYGDFYEVSNYGDIRSVKTHRIRRKNINDNGYYFVSGSYGDRNSKKTFKVHKAVAESFIDNPDNLPIVNHKDGNKLNNYVENLEWCTHSENIQHAYDNNFVTIRYGKNNHNSKLNEKDVKYIRENYIPKDKEYGVRALARKFGVHHTTILKVLDCTYWKHIL